VLRTRGSIFLLAGDRLTFFVEAEWLIFFVAGQRVWFAAEADRATFAPECGKFLDIQCLFVRFPDVPCERALTASGATPSV
jgi:hypothetical protein